MSALKQENKRLLSKIITDPISEEEIEEEEVSPRRNKLH